MDRQLGVMGNSTDVVHLCVFHPSLQLCSTDFDRYTCN